MNSLQKITQLLVVFSTLTLVSAPASAGFGDWLRWLFKIPPKVEEPVEPTPTTPGDPDEYPDGLRPAIFVGNNWDGTIDIYDPHTFKRIKKLNAVPDKEQRLDELSSSIKRWIVSTFIKEVIGEGNHQMVDDMFPSNDGRHLFISRPSFADVIALDVNSGEIKWRTPVEGSRSDHSAISPDGKVFLVSASTAGKVHAIDTENGEIIGGFESGDQPHENTYSRDGKLIYHASIGKV